MRRFGCENCFKKSRAEKADDDAKEAKTKVVYQNATKQFMIREAPRVLTLHLKRFEQRGFTMVRMSQTVNFGATLFLGPFVTRDVVLGGQNSGTEGGGAEATLKENDLIYDLYGVVVHSGTLNSGHYTAYVKVTLPNGQRRWFYVSDSSVSVATESAVFSCSGAYILFYERRA